jgi:hypothetical protein
MATHLLGLSKIITPSWVKRLLPMEIKADTKDRIRDLALWYQARSWQDRALPRFIIGGAQKCGTTTLYDQLALHPRVVPAIVKEPGYFSWNFRKGAKWYRAHFPIVTGGRAARGDAGAEPVTGEASPSYLYAPFAFSRMRAMLPETRLILMLRNPADRAYSSYQHQVRYKRESRSFAEAIAGEKRMLDRELPRLLADPDYYSPDFRFFGYLYMGNYADHLRECFRHFPREQVMVIQSEEFFSSNKEVFAKVLQFLDLDGIQLQKYVNSNKKIYEKIDPEIRARLVDHYAERNEDLFTLLGHRFDWT